MLEEKAEKRKNRDTAVSILRGISIRMPLMIYGADLTDESKEITLDNFTSLIDDGSWEQFIEGDFGVDFGAAAGKKAGARLTALYNIIWARPAWTDEGSWAIYAGPGISLGYVADKVVYDVGDARISIFDKGAMLAI